LGTAPCAGPFDVSAPLLWIGYFFWNSWNMAWTPRQLSWR